MPENAIDPIHQFNIERIFSFHPFGFDASFTNASLLMVIILGLVSLIMIMGTSKRSMVPGRLQAAAEMSYEFVADTVRGTAGQEGMRFFPFVFSLFMFVLFANLLGLLPFSYTVTSQIAVTFALAALVMAVVITYGLMRHGTHFLQLFAPSGVTPVILPFIVLIEIISFAGAADLAIRPPLRQHAGRPYHASKYSAASSCCCSGPGSIAAALIAPASPALASSCSRRSNCWSQRAAGLCVCHFDLRLPQRRNPSGPLINIRNNKRVPDLSTDGVLNGSHSR